MRCSYVHHLLCLRIWHMHTLFHHDPHKAKRARGRQNGCGKKGCGGDTFYQIPGSISARGFRTKIFFSSRFANPQTLRRRGELAIDIFSVTWFVISCASWLPILPIPEIPYVTDRNFWVTSGIWNAVWWGFAHPMINNHRKKLKAQREQNQIEDAS